LLEPTALKWHFDIRGRLRHFDGSHDGGSSCGHPPYDVAIRHACGMPDYRRFRVPGGTYFFTINLLERHSGLLMRHIGAPREAILLYNVGVDR
jgi:hypothetical protein